jgi:HK97 family phage prohead protease
MERKEVDAVVTGTTDEGVVEAVWAVMGNVDGGNDRIHPGAFTKTFTERGHQVALLDNHRTDSVMSALGTVKTLREVNEAELPAQIKSAYPDATGGAWGQFQFLLDTPEGAGAFKRIKAGAVSKWSFGYDALDKDYSTEESEDGQDITVRNLRTIKLYEVSPVLFAMNEATATTDAKAADEEPEEKEHTPVQLSTKDKARLQELFKEINDILAEAGTVDEPEAADALDESENSEEDEAPLPEEPEEAADEAGSEDEPPTSNTDDLLMLIEIEEAELELMEV